MYWSDDVDWRESIAEEHGPWTGWGSFVRTTEQPVLLGFNAGTRGREIEAMTDEQIVDSAMTTLRTVYGDDISEPTDFQIARWPSDPFARGSYWFCAVGSAPDMRRELPVHWTANLCRRRSHQRGFLRYRGRRIAVRPACRGRGGEYVAIQSAIEASRSTIVERWANFSNGFI